MPLLLALALVATPARSVYRVHPADGAVIAASLALVAAAYGPGKALIHPSCPCDPGSLGVLDRWVVGHNSHLADEAANVTVAVAVLGTALISAAEDGPRRALFEDLVVETEVLAVGGALVTVAKYAAQRPLPVVYAGQAPELLHAPGGYRSFYSGHTAAAVGALTFGAGTWARRHGGAPWLWAAAALGGAAVGAEKLLAGRHFTTDVIAGAAAGAALGLALPALHARDTALAVAPLPGGAQLALARAF